MKLTFWEKLCITALMLGLAWGGLTKLAAQDPPLRPDGIARTWCEDGHGARAVIDIRAVTDSLLLVEVLAHEAVHMRAVNRRMTQRLECRPPTTIELLSEEILAYCEGIPKRMARLGVSRNEARESIWAVLMVQFWHSLPSGLIGEQFSKECPA